MTEAEKAEKEAKAKAEAEVKAKAEAEAKAKAEQEAKAQAEKAAKNAPKADLPKVESIKAAEKWFLANTSGTVLCATKDGKQFESDSFPKAKKWFLENGVEA
jgi:membrane protein involved in colicin uptake